MLEIESPTATTHDHEINADLSLARKTQYLHSYYAVVCQPKHPYRQH